MADPNLVATAKRNIAGIESGGRYDAMGPVTSKGDRAYGKYQVMGENIPSWTREATGVEATPDAFLLDKDLQERTVDFRLGKYLDEHGGSVRDAASLWHSGLPYAEAVAKGRKDQLGTTTQSYADRVAGGTADVGAGGGSPLIIALPDGRKVNLGVNPSAELQAQVKAKILVDFPELAPKAPAPVAPTVPETQPGFGATTGTSEEQSFEGPEPLAEAPPARVGFPSPAPHMRTSPTLGVERPFRELSPDEAAGEINQIMGSAPDSFVGRYSAMVGKPIVDALTDVFAGAFGVAPGEGGAFSPEAPAGGDPTKGATWLDAASRAAKLLHPLAVPAEIAGNLTNEILLDMGAPPELSAAIATIMNIAAGAKTPGIDTPPKTGPWYRHTSPGRRQMPFQGSAATEQAAADATAAATRADEAVAAARTGGEAATTGAETHAEELADVARRARAAADDAERAADEAAGRVAPSPELRERVAEELTPNATVPTAGSTSAARELGRQLEEVRTPTKGIYDALYEKAVAEHRSLDPAEYKGMAEQLAALREELGPTLSGQAKEVFDNVDATVNAGQRMGYDLLDAYKQQLDTLFPGRVPHGASPRQRLLYDLKWDVREKMRSMLDGEDRQWAEAADAMWRDEIIGKDSPLALGNLTRLAEKNPATFVERVLGKGTSDKQATYARNIMRRLEANNPAKAQELRETVMDRAIDDATDEATGSFDPRVFLKTVGKYKREFYDAMVSPEAQNLFDVMRQELGEVGTTAGAARRGRQWASAAEDEAAAAARAATKTGKQAAKDVSAAEAAAGKARTAAETAGEAATAPNRLAKFTAGGIQMLIPAAAASVLGPMASTMVSTALGAGGGAVGGLVSYLWKPNLAKIIADSKGANLLARALRTPAESPATITILESLRNRGTSVGWFDTKRKEERRRQ